MTDYTIIEAYIYKATWRDQHTDLTTTAYIANTQTLLDLHQVASQINHVEEGLTLIAIKEVNFGYIITRTDHPHIPLRPPIRPTDTCPTPIPRPSASSTGANIEPPTSA